MKLKEWFTFQNLIVLLCSICIFVSSFIIDYSDLPKGYELPKVLFLNYFSIFLLLLSFLYLLYRIFYKQNFSLKADSQILFFVLISFFISTILSPYSDIAVNGNSFRNQGVVFYLLITLQAFILFKFISIKNHLFIAFALWASSLVQGIIAITQYSRLSSTNPSLLDDGLWINGAYGQANFFSTHIILGIVFGLYIFSLNTNKLLSRTIIKILKFLVLLSIIFLIFTLFLSYSIWGWVTCFFLITLYFLRLVLKDALFSKLMLMFFVLTIPLITLFIRTSEYNLRIDIWLSSINILVSESQTSLLRPLFGYGFDTLASVFKTFSVLGPSIIDRGHNLFIDILMQLGLVGLALFSLLLVPILKSFTKIKSSISKITPTFIYAFTIVVLLFKMFIHEYSAVNFYQLIVLLAVFLGVYYKSKSE